LIFHVMNRGAKRAPLFESSADYEAFVRILGAGLERFAVALFAYCLMRNHWHFLLSPRIDGALSSFMHWLTTTHARRWQSLRHADGQGAVYQGRFKAVPVCDDEHFLWVCRYVERNPVRAALVDTAAEWRWSSLSQRLRQEPFPPLSEWPAAMPPDWIVRVNTPQTDAELEVVRRGIKTSQPIGSEAWREAVVRTMGVASPRRRGRPARTAPITVLEK
jgi:putative transposase